MAVKEKQYILCLQRPHFPVKIISQAFICELYHILSMNHVVILCVFEDVYSQVARKVL